MLNNFNILVIDIPVIDILNLNITLNNSTKDKTEEIYQRYGGANAAAGIPTLLPFDVMALGKKGIFQDLHWQSGRFIRHFWRKMINRISIEGQE